MHRGVLGEIGPANQVVQALTDIMYTETDTFDTVETGNAEYCLGDSNPVAGWAQTLGNGMTDPLGQSITEVGAFYGRTIVPGPNAIVDCSSGGMIAAVHEDVGKGHVYVYTDEWVTYTSQWNPSPQPAGYCSLDGSPDPAVQFAYQVPQFWENAIAYAAEATMCHFLIQGTIPPLAEKLPALLTSHARDRPCPFPSPEPAWGGPQLPRGPGGRGRLRDGDEAGRQVEQHELERLLLGRQRARGIVGGGPVTAAPARHDARLSPSTHHRHARRGGSRRVVRGKARGGRPRTRRPHGRAGRHALRGASAHVQIAIHDATARRRSAHGGVKREVLGSARCLSHARIEEFD